MQSRNGDGSSSIWVDATIFCTTRIGRRQHLICRLTQLLTRQASVNSFDRGRRDWRKCSASIKISLQLRHAGLAGLPRRLRRILKNAVSVSAPGLGHGDMGRGSK